MKFISLEPSEFEKVIKKLPGSSYLQTTEIAKLREKNGWTPYYFAVEEKGKIIAATMLVARPTFLGKSTYYAPGGPLLDYTNTKLVNFFFKNLKNYAKSHNGYLLHIEPNYELIQRDRDGEIIKEGFNHQAATLQLKKLGFNPTTSDNPKYQFVLELDGQKPEEIFKTFKQNTRNLINRTERNGIKIRELKKEELPIFKQITESTSERRHFADKTLAYYETMYDLFAKQEEIKFIIAEAEDTPIAAAMFMTYGEEIVYLFSGSDAKYMKKYNAQYAIQWYMIKYALKNGFKRYNFYGIQGLPDSKSKGYGIYLFKKGFTTPENGRVIELLGAYELPLSPLYYLHRTLKTIGKIIKK